MKRSIGGSFLIAGLLALLSCSCKPKANTPHDAKLKDNVYTNRFFGFQVQLTSTWKILDKPSRREMRKGSEAIFGGDKELADAAVEAGVDPLLMAIDLSSGRTLGILAESVADLPEIRTGTDFLEPMLELTTGQGKPLQKVSSITSARLLGRDFNRVDVAGNVLGVHQYQAIFVAIEKGHALTVMVGAKSGGEVNEALAKVGLLSGQHVQSLATAVPKAAGSKARTSPSSHWFHDIKLQGIGGTDARRFAIINGRTLASGEAASVKTSTRDVLLRCVAISNASVTVTIEGLKGERTLSLN